MKELIAFLQTVYPLSPSLVEYLSNTVKIKEVKRKEYLLKAGTICRNVYFINKGLLRCFYSKGDREISRWFMLDGDVIFSISSFYEQKPGFENIQALEDCHLYYISFSELEYIYNNFMEFNYIGRVLTIKYHQLWDEQLYGIQIKSAAERYQWLLTNHPHLVLRVPAKYLASYLGITEVTLSRIKGSKEIGTYESMNGNT